MLSGFAGLFIFGQPRFIFKMEEKNNNICEFCGKLKGEDEVLEKWWDRDGDIFYNICKECLRRIDNLNKYNGGGC